MPEPKIDTARSKPEMDGVLLQSLKGEVGTVSGVYARRDQLDGAYLERS
jgi:hypothetical protein